MVPCSTDFQHSLWPEAPASDYGRGTKQPCEDTMGHPREIIEDPADGITHTPETSFWSQHMGWLAFSCPVVCALFLEKNGRVTMDHIHHCCLHCLAVRKLSQLATTALHFNDSPHSWLYFIFPAPTFLWAHFPQQWKFYVTVCICISHFILFLEKSYNSIN